MKPIKPIRLEWMTLVLLFLIIGAIWAFVELADEVIEGETLPLDRQILLALRNPADHADPIGPKWLEEVGRDFTALGGVGVLTFLTLAVVGFLRIERHYRAMWILLTAVAGGLFISFLLKNIFARPRPDLVPHLSYVVTASFPSGHSMMSAVTYLTMGAILARFFKDYRLKIYFLSLSILITLLVGISRVYLGVHWPTDVLAGWTIGAAWALVCWLAARWLQKRGYADEH